MQIDEAVEIPQCSLVISNAVSPFDRSPISKTKKESSTRDANKEYQKYVVDIL